MQNKETRKDLAVRVMNDCMAMRNLNQAEIADRLGVSRATVSNWLKTPQGMTTKNVERVLFVFHKEAASIMEHGSVNAPTIDDFRKKLVSKIMDAGFDTAPHSSSAVLRRKQKTGFCRCGLIPPQNPVFCVLKCLKNV